MIPKKASQCLEERTMLSSGTLRCTSRTAYGYTTQTHTHMQVDGSYNCGQHLGNSWIVQKESGILRIGNSIKIYPVSIRVVVLAHLSRVQFSERSPVEAFESVRFTDDESVFCCAFIGRDALLI